MSVFLRGRIKPTGKIKFSTWVNENDWLLASEPARRFEDRGSVVEDKDDQQDWGTVPKRTEEG